MEKDKAISKIVFGQNLLVLLVGVLIIGGFLIFVYFKYCGSLVGFFYLSNPIFLKICDIGDKFSGLK